MWVSDYIVSFSNLPVMVFVEGLEILALVLEELQHFMKVVSLLLMTLLVRIQVIYSLLQGLDGHAKAGDGLAKLVDGVYEILAFHVRQRLIFTVRRFLDMNR